MVEGTLLSEVFPVDDDGIYFVLTSADVAEVGGFCSSYCGWHTFLQWDSQVRPAVLFPVVAFANTFKPHCDTLRYFLASRQISSTPSSATPPSAQLFVLVRQEPA